MVKACISQKTNYVDITGETYVRTFTDKLNHFRLAIPPIHAHKIETRGTRIIIRFAKVAGEVLSHPIDVW